MYMKEKTFDVDQHLYYCETYLQYDGSFEDWDGPFVAYIKETDSVFYITVSNNQ